MQGGEIQGTAGSDGAREVGGQKAVLAFRPGLSRRGALGVGTSAALGAAGLAGCSSATAALFNPATRTWLADLGKSIAAAEVQNAIDGGLRGAFAHWTKPARKTVQDSATAILSNDHRFWYNSWSHQVPPVLLVSVCAAEEGDPMADHLVACVNGGSQAVVFEPWAWHALSMYVHDLTGARKGDDLAAYRSLCLMTLIPSGTRPKTGSSPEGTVAWMTYASRNGTVEIAKVAEPDGAMSAIVKVSGILDARGAPSQRKYTLPTTPAKTSA